MSATETFAFRNSYTSNIQKQSQQSLWWRLL